MSSRHPMYNRHARTQQTMELSSESAARDVTADIALMKQTASKLIDVIFELVDDASHLDDGNEIGNMATLAESQINKAVALLEKQAKKILSESGRSN